MSIEPRSDTPAGASGGVESQPAAGNRRRSAVERTVVWTAIGLLLALAAVEVHARLGYSTTLKAIEEALAAADAAGGGLSFAEVEGLVSGFPGATVRDERASEVRTYRWRSILHDYRIHLRVEKGDEPAHVIAMATGSDMLSRRAVFPSDPAPPPDLQPGGVGAAPGPARVSSGNPPAVGIDIPAGAGTIPIER